MHKIYKVLRPKWYVYIFGPKWYRTKVIYCRNFSFYNDEKNAKNVGTCCCAKRKCKKILSKYSCKIAIKALMKLLSKFINMKIQADEQLNVLIYFVGIRYKASNIREWESLFLKYSRD
jgi:hypothetical protein